MGVLTLLWLSLEQKLLAVPSLQSRCAGTTRARFLPILTKLELSGFLKMKQFKLVAWPCALASGKEVHGPQPA